MHRRKFIAGGVATFALTACDLIADAPISGGSGPARHQIMGSGQPTVVFESGLGDGMNSWNPVFPAVAARTRAIRYSRPGYFPGAFAANRRDSDGDGQRTGPEVARHLRTLLTREAAAAPYILVGHSVGGLYSLAFAKAYPGLVAGIVLVDGRLPTFAPACRQAGLGTCTPEASILQPAHIRAEINGIAASEAAAPLAPALGAIPITVIAATQPPAMTDPRLHPVWLRTQRAYADAAQNGRFVQAAGAGHFIHRGRPALVIDEITRMLARVRA